MRIVRKSERIRQEIKQKEELALQGIAVGISERLHTAMPGSRWRWVCYPAGFALNGGIARIEVVCSLGNQRFVDVCLAQNGYMTLHLANVVELAASVAGLPDASSETAVLSASVDAKNASIIEVLAKSPAPTTALPASTTFWDEESVSKWYNIVLIDALATIIGDLNAKGGLYIYISQNGKACTEENDSIAILHDFGEMPDVVLWVFITEKLGEAGLFAEVQEDNRLFISWA